VRAVDAPKSRNRKRAAVTIWFLRDVGASARASIVTVVVLSIVEAASQLLLFASLLGFAQSATDGTTSSFELRGLDLGWVEQIANVTTWPGLVTALGVISAIAGYLASRLSLRIAESYARQAASRTLQHLRPSPSDKAEPADDARRSLIRDVTMLFRNVRPIIALTTPLVRLVIVSAVLLVLAPLFAGVLVAGALLAVPVVFVLAKQVVSASRVHEIPNSDLKEQTARVATAVSLPQLDDETVTKMVAEYESSEAVSQRFDSLRTIMLNRSRVDFATRLALAIAVGLVAALLLWRIDPSDRLGRLVLVILLLRLIVSDIRSLFTLMGTIGRFYPQFSRYAEIVAGPFGPPTTSGAGRELRHLDVPTLVVCSRLPSAWNARSWLGEVFETPTEIPVYFLPRTNDGTVGEPPLDLSTLTDLTERAEPGIVVTTEQNRRELDRIASRLAGHQLVLVTRSTRQAPSIIEQVAHVDPEGCVTYGTTDWWSVYRRDVHIDAAVDGEDEDELDDDV